MKKRLLALACAVSSVLLLIAAPASAERSESSVEVFYPRFGGGLAYPWIYGGEGRNDWRLELVDHKRELEITDRSGKPITLRDFGERGEVCVGGGTPTITCHRNKLVRPLITLRVTLGRGDHFDIGKPGCADNGGFESDQSFIDHGTYIGPNGADRLLLVKNHANVRGCGGSDQVELQSSRFSGGSGVDWITAKGGEIHGDAGADQIEVSGSGAAFGDGGSDSMADHKGSSKLVGGPGSDGLASGPGRDWLDGGPGRDILHAGYRSKIIDYVPQTYVEKPTEPDRLLCGSGRDKAMAGHNSRLRGCERVIWLPRKFVVQ